MAIELVPETSEDLYMLTRLSSLKDLVEIPNTQDFMHSNAGLLSVLRQQ
jgi:stalled ribosome rescue protein Dom34